MDKYIEFITAAFYTVALVAFVALSVTLTYLMIVAIGKL